MDKRYQVFVSSTYADLKEERQHVIQALMEMDCIPAGMELFPAADEEQWNFIQSVINDCDYYLLIIGGRYGSLTQDGISYTEKEFDYAVERGLRVIALLHESPGEIPLEKSEGDPNVRAKLDAFREKVSANRLVKFWREAKELPGLVALSLSKTIKTHPAIGWVRANRVSNEAVLEELNEVRKENAELRAAIAEMEANVLETPEGLAGLDDTIEINGTYFNDYGKRTFTASFSWKDIFAIVSPYLLKQPHEDLIKRVLLTAAREQQNTPNRTPSLSDQDFQTVAIQLKALGLVNIRLSRTTEGRMGLFWSLTPRGERLMYELRTVKGAE